MSEIVLTSEHLRAADFAFRKARVKALTEQPFYGTVAMGLQSQVCESHHGHQVDTCATDGKSIFINPSYFLGKDERARFIIILHEIGHVALGHNLRRGNRNQALWNIACDHAINLLLKEAGYALDDWLCDEKYRGWSAERIYSDLNKPKPKPKPKPRPERGDVGDTTGGGTPEEDEEPGDYTEPEDADEPDSSGSGEPDLDEPDTQPGGHQGEVWDQTDADGKDLDDEGREEARRKHADDVWKAKEAAGGRGASPSLDREIGEIVSPSADWDTLLAEYWNSGGGDPVSATWTRFDRRAMMCGMWEPAKINSGIDWVVLGFDVSWSINQDEADAYVAQINALRDSVQANRITVVPFNSYVKSETIVEIEPGEDVPSRFRVGGGTRFSPVFNWVDRQEEVPDFVIMFTDMGASDFPDPPQYPVLWASSVPITVGIDDPPFGEYIEIEFS